MRTAPIEVIVVAVAVWVAVFGLAAYREARRLDRHAPLWFTYGAVLGPVALVLLRAAPPGHCRACGTATRGWQWTCWWCREDVRSTPTRTLALVARMSGSTPVSGAAAPASGAAAPVQTRPRPASQRERLRQARTPGTIRAGPAAPEASTADPGTETEGAPGTGAASNGARHLETTNRAGSVAATNGAAVPASRPAPFEPAAPPFAGPAAAQSAAPSGMLATAIYVTGSSSLESGRRYSIAVEGDRLQVLGPSDTHPLRVVLERPLATITAQAVEGRFVVSDPRGAVLAFMSVSGPSPRQLTAMITEAALHAVAE